LPNEREYVIQTYSSIFKEPFLEESKKKLPPPVMRRYLLAVSDCFGLHSAHVCCLD